MDDTGANAMEAAMDAVEVRIEGIDLKIERLTVLLRSGDDGALAKFVRRIGGKRG